MSSLFLGRGKNYKHFALGDEVEVVVYACMTGEKIDTIWITVDHWYLLYKIQKSTECDGPMRDIMKAETEDDALFIAFQEHVGGCLRVPSWSIKIGDVTCNGIGVVTTVACMTMTSKIKAITGVCWEDTQIDLPGVPTRLSLDTPWGDFVWSEAFWKVQRCSKSDHVDWILIINIIRDRQEAQPPAFVEVKLVSVDKMDDTGDHAVFAVFTRNVHELRGTYRFGPFDLHTYNRSCYGAFGFFLCLKSWEKKSESIEY